MTSCTSAGKSRQVICKKPDEQERFVSLQTVGIVIFSYLIIYTLVLNTIGMKKAWNLKNLSRHLPVCKKYVVPSPKGGNGSKISSCQQASNDETLLQIRTQYALGFCRLDNYLLDTISEWNSSHSAQWGGDALEPALGKVQRIPPSIGRKSSSSMLLSIHPEGICYQAPQYGSLYFCHCMDPHHKQISFEPLAGTSTFWQSRAIEVAVWSKTRFFVYPGRLAGEEGPFLTEGCRGQIRGQVPQDGSTLLWTKSESREGRDKEGQLPVHPVGLILDSNWQPIEMIWCERGRAPTGSEADNILKGHRAAPDDQNKATVQEQLKRKLVPENNSTSTYHEMRIAAIWTKGKIC
ncbi:hypothetical protein DFH07DRAFT_765204 [Mycena maculata]|uniref:Uncharacterized protein n=1 Tax=Mycena maculata TaxID=230809 RepID=A0AAD7NYQ8_9AGAR|nr:hypothetical protein DFH07DRAFT_765204 [Mycena maculata]